MERLTFSLCAQPPFRLDLTAWLLRRQPDNGIDRWDGATYSRILIFEKIPHAVQVTQAGSLRAPRVRVTVSARRLAPGARASARRTLVRMLGLGVDLRAFYRFAAAHPRLKALVEPFRGVKPPRFPTPFEAAINGIACQQLSLSMGIRLLNRLADSFGKAMTVGKNVQHAFPTPDRLARLEPGALRKLGFNRQKERAIIELGRAVVEGRLDLQRLASLEDTAALERLAGLRGVGRWTAQYVLLRGLGRLHLFPQGDVGARRGLQAWLHSEKQLDESSVRRILKPWRRYAGLIYLHMSMKRLSDSGWLEGGP